MAVNGDKALQREKLDRMNELLQKRKNKKSSCNKSIVELNR